MGRYIYGAGQLGKQLEAILRKQRIGIDSFLVSKGYKTQEEIHGIPVMEYELPAGQNAETGDICYLTVQTDTAAIKESLLAGGLTVIDAFSDLDSVRISGTYWEDFFRKNSKNGIYGAEIQFQDFSILNPYAQSVDYQNSLYAEIEDLLCPLFGMEEIDFFEGPYEYGNVCLKQDDVVIDCGSNIGLFSIYAGVKGCRVHAFEPVEQNIAYLMHMKEQLGDRMAIAPYALGDHMGSVPFDAARAGTNCRIAEDDAMEGAIEVPMVTIDEYVKRENLARVDFIKADIEGAERLMLRGAFRTLRDFAPKLALCTYHLPDDKEVMESLILEANPGYVIEHKYKKLYAYVPERR